MPIALKLATADTPEPWQAAAAAEVPGLDYAREGLPSAGRKSPWRTAWAVIRRVAAIAGAALSAAVLVIALVLLAAGAVIRFVLSSGAHGLLALRGLGRAGIYERLRYGGRVPLAQVA
jgi:hypothetical protein